MQFRSKYLDISQSGPAVERIELRLEAQSRQINDRGSRPDSRPLGWIDARDDAMQISRSDFRRDTAGSGSQGQDIKFGIEHGENCRCGIADARVEIDNQFASHASSV